VIYVLLWRQSVKRGQETKRVGIKFMPGSASMSVLVTVVIATKQCMHHPAVSMPADYD
jgi:hypothetical protein